MVAQSKKTQTKRRQPAKRPLPALSVKKKITFGSRGTLQLSLVIKKKPAPKKTAATKKRKTTAKRKKQQTSSARQRTVSLAFIILGILGSLYFTFQPFAGNDRPARAEAPLITPKRLPGASSALPASNATKVRIPAIAVDAPVMTVGKMQDGSLEVPSSDTEVGQYRFAPTPGETGPAVIVGHLDSLTGPAVFWRLRELQIGQEIFIDRQDGTTAKFRVDQVEDFDQNAFPTDKIYGNISHPGLRLITCGGSFNVLKNRYTTNTVVFATLIN